MPRPAQPCPPGQPPANRLHTMRRVALAVLVLAAVQPAAAQQPSATGVPGIVTSGDHKKLQGDLAAAIAERDALQKKLDLAVPAQTRAEARATAAEKLAKARPEGVPPEQLDTLRKELDTTRRARDAALADAEDTKAQLTKTRTDLARATAAGKDDTALRTERDRLKAELATQQDSLATLRRQVADRDKRIAGLQAANAVLAAAPGPSVATNPPPPPSQPTAPPPGPATASATPPPVAALPANGTELAVPNCGAACPTFIVIPYTGPQTLGSGDEAITARFEYRFAMAKTEVTLGQWKAFWAAPDRDYAPVKTENTYCNWHDSAYAKDDRHPVRCVNVADAQAYARWFAKRHGAQLGVRVSSVGLPTELEWEYSARGGRNSQQYLWADGADKAESCRYARTGDCPGGVNSVASLRENGYGLHDMIGNVWEWTATDWRDDRKSVEANHRDDGKSGVLAARSVRGAAFNSSVYGLRLAYRDSYAPGFRDNDLGFRLVARIAP